MRKVRILLAAATGILLTAMSASALQITQIEFDLHLADGGSGTYSFQVINNETDAQDVTVYLGDWTRSETGDNDFLALNSARWLFGRTFKKGDELDIKYTVNATDSSIAVTGTYICGNPSTQGKIAGASDLSAPSVTVTPETPTDAVVVVTRTASAKTDDGSIAVYLHVQALQDFVGLRIDEVFSSHVDVDSVDTAGGEFSVVSRSCGDWIAVSPQTFRIAPGDRQTVNFTVDVPADVAGTYWAMIFVQGAPRPQQREGATVLAVERFGVKIYETVPGTEIRMGRIDGVRRTDSDPLTFDITFTNTGNVQLNPQGAITIIAQSGDTVRTIPIEEFPILPDKTRIITIKSDEDMPLTAGYYRALVTIDYGGDNLAGGTRDFRVQ